MTCRGSTLAYPASEHADRPVATRRPVILAAERVVVPRLRATSHLDGNDSSTRIFTTFRSYLQAMIKPIYVITCDYGIYDAWRKRHSAIGIFDYFSARSFPARIRFDVVCKWQADEGEGEGDFVVRVTTVSGSEGRRTVAVTNGVRTMFDPFTHTAANAFHFDIEVAVAGDYQFEFYFDNQIVHALTLPVIPED